MDQPGRAIVMKVGVHLGEPWEAIVERKLAEEQAAGVAYWGRRQRLPSAHAGPTVR